VIQRSVKITNNIVLNIKFNLEYLCLRELHGYVVHDVKTHYCQPQQNHVYHYYLGLQSQRRPEHTPISSNTGLPY